jgi:hypothetical protein
VTALAFVVMTGNRALGQATNAADRGDTESASRHARTAARWAPWSSEPISLQAHALLERGGLAEARRLYATAIEQDRENWELWLGLALASNGQAHKRALAHARRLNPLATELRELDQSGARR